MIPLKSFAISFLLFAVAACAGGPSTGTPAPATNTAAAVPIAAPAPQAGRSLTTQPATQTADGYKLVWADEFTKDGPLNPDDWIFERGFVRNQELQFYQPDNATCSGGTLIIEGRREEKANPRQPRNIVPAQVAGNKNFEYTSASVLTRGKHSWLYGRFEIRAKIDTRPGSWPAFWTLGTAPGWPGNGEIDIMEYYRNMVLANIAWAKVGGGPQWNSKTKPLSSFTKDWSDQFHTWRMDWDADFIKLYCDDNLMNSQDLSRTINPNGVNPFHAPAYLMLNLAIGGQNGGDPANTTFPMKFQIDYVRVYQKPSQIAAPATRPSKQ